MSPHNRLVAVRHFVIATLVFVAISITRSTSAESSGAFAGITLGTPGALNLTFYTPLNEQLGMRMTGGGIPVQSGQYWIGVQGDLLRRLTSWRSLKAKWGITVGYLKARDSDDDRLSYFYGGVVANMKLRSFFLGTGLVVGSSKNEGVEDFSNPQLLLELGLVFTI
jgi:hypothetical protein